MMLRQHWKHWGLAFILCGFFAAYLLGFISVCATVITWGVLLIKTFTGGAAGLDDTGWHFYVWTVFAGPALYYPVKFLLEETGASFAKQIKPFHPYGLAYVLFFATPALMGGWAWQGYLTGAVLAATCGPLLAYGLKKGFA
jgi:hypothetical protein